MHPRQPGRDLAAVRTLLQSVEGSREERGSRMAVPWPMQHLPARPLLGQTKPSTCVARQAVRLTTSALQVTTLVATGLASDGVHASVHSSVVWAHAKCGSKLDRRACLRKDAWRDKAPRAAGSLRVEATRRLYDARSRLAASSTSHGRALGDQQKAPRAA